MLLKHGYDCYVIISFAHFCNLALNCYVQLTCQCGLSLSLGSSHCIPCFTHWLAVLIVVAIAAFLAGIALVALLLFLNLTIAIGTLLCQHCGCKG